MTYDSLEFEKLISASDTIGIVGHFNPDGDSVGSVSATFHYLNSINKKSRVILPGDYPSFLSFLDKNNDYLIYTKSKKESDEYINSCDLIICLDFNKASRTEGMSVLLSSSKAKKILIDHHPDPEREFFDLVFSDTETSSACELLFWILMGCSDIRYDVMKLPLLCAEALGTGMITDTNNFNNSVVPTTFEMASLLLKRGIPLEKINKTVFGSYSENRMRLMGAVLSNDMVVIDDIKSAFIILTLERQKEFDYQIGDSEGFVNLPLLIDGIGVSALFVEKEGFIRVSLRSKVEISVNKLSNLYFNGGGHDKAAGGKLFMPLDEVPAYFENSIRDYIKNRHTIC